MLCFELGKTPNLRAWGELRFWNPHKLALIDLKEVRMVRRTLAS